MKVRLEAFGRSASAAWTVVYTETEARPARDDGLRDIMECVSTAAGNAGRIAEALAFNGKAKVQGNADNPLALLIREVQASSLKTVRTPILEHEAWSRPVQCLT
ncbi:MAG: hypothetical protein AB1592_06355 [Pseudomonadota bacterium]